MVPEIVAKPVGVIKSVGGVYTQLYCDSPIELTSKIYANDVRFSIRLIAKPDKNIKWGDKQKHVQKRGNIVAYSENSKRRYRFLLRNTQKLWSHELEVGYPSDFPMDGKKVKRDIRLLKESLQREYPDIAWTWRLGFQQKRGEKGLGYAPHVHFLIDRPVYYKWLAKRWYEIVGSGDPRHLKAGTHVDKIKNVGKMINYMVLPSLRSGRMRELSSEQGECAPRGKNQKFETDGPPAHCSTRALPIWQMTKKH